MALHQTCFLLIVLSFPCIQALTPDMYLQMRYPNLVKYFTATNNSNHTNSSTCSIALQRIEQNQQLLTYYIDAVGKPQSGVLDGNVAWYGSYDECTLIPGAHYCLANIYFAVPKQLKIPSPGFAVRWGLCVPKECSATDVTVDLYRLIYTFKLEKELFPVGFVPGGSSVVCAAQSKYTVGVILTLTLCAIILWLCLVGTMIEIIQNIRKHNQTYDGTCSGIFCLKETSSASVGNTTTLPVERSVIDVSDKHNLIQEPVPELVPAVGESNNILLELLLCFSIIRNTRRIMDTKVPASAITSLNGMRVLSMWWVILGHTVMMIVYGGNVVNIVSTLKITQRFTFQAILNATFSVDSFFFLSGLLVSYLSLREMDKRGRLPLLKFYFHRFWRLTPSYMFVILFYDKLTGFLNEGPFWFMVQTNSPCDKYWWTNLLYINNFYPKSLEGECLAWSWYMANDMQFYIISPIILYAIYKFRVIGFIVSVTPFFIAQFVSTAVIISKYDLVMVGQADQPKGNQSDMIYIKPYCRIGVYLVGLGLGYLLHSQRGRTRRMPLALVFAGWTIAIAMALLVVYGPYSVYKEGGKPFTVAENITYGMFSRVAWGLAVAWVIYACQNGYGGLVNNILSARFWIPLSRLTYGAYLVHLIILGVFIYGNTTNLAYSDLTYALFFCGVLVLSYAASFILAVGIEFPMMQLEKVLFKSRDRDR